MNVQIDIGDSGLAQRLRREISGEVLFGAADRGRYATDASIYQMAPVGVIVPRRIEDVMAALAICREEGVPVLPRGGGTSQCGQTVNRALVMDCTKYLNRVLEVAGTRALVEPGIVLGRLNAQLKAGGMFFAVDPSTHARCTIGGMAGNNSCGSKSIRYGLMADNVTAIDALRIISGRRCPLALRIWCSGCAAWARQKPRKSRRGFRGSCGAWGATTWMF
jgi:FAD/FMN-containing dehydrogenase